MLSPDPLGLLQAALLAFEQETARQQQEQETAGNGDESEERNVPTGPAQMNGPL